MDGLAENGSRCEDAAEVLKALAHPIRLRIVALLCERERTVSELAEALQAAQPVVSQQLRILRLHELVAVTRQQNFHRYRLAEPRLHALIQCMESCSLC